MSLPSLARVSSAPAATLRALGRKLFALGVSEVTERQLDHSLCVDPLGHLPFCKRDERQVFIGSVADTR